MNNTLNGNVLVPVKTAPWVCNVPGTLLAKQVKLLLLIK